MKHLTIVLIIGIFLCSGSVVFAAKGGQKGPSERAYERANENAAFKRDKDWTPGNHEDNSEKKHDGKHKGHHKKHKKDKHDGDSDHKDGKKEHDSDADDDSSDDASTNQTKE